MSIEGQVKSIYDILEKDGHPLTVKFSLESILASKEL